MRGHRAWIMRAAFEAAIAFAAVIASVVWLFDPQSIERTAIGHTTRELLPVWQLLYGTGGAAILVGLALQSLRIEMVGLCLFTAALAINGVAVIDFTQAVGVAAGSTFVALAVACGARGAFLLSRWRRWHGPSSDDR